MTQLTLQQAYSTAVQLQNSGKLPEAEALYRQILAIQPDQPDTTCMLGVLAFQVGKKDLGIELVRRAIALNPNNGDFHGNLGGLLAGMGKTDDAIAAFRQSVALKPNSPDVLFSLSMLLHRKGLRDEAINACTQALKYRPLYPEVYCVLGDCYMEKNELAEAAACYRKSLSQNSGNGAQMPVQQATVPTQARAASSTLWPEYNGPPLEPSSMAAMAFAMSDAQAPEPPIHPDLAHLKDVAGRDDLPSSVDLFSFQGEKLPCWRDEDSRATDGEWLTAKNLYPYYFGIFQKLARPDKVTRVLEIGVHTGHVGVAFAKAVQSPAVYVGVDPNLYLRDGLDRAAASLRKLREPRNNFEYFLIEGYSWNIAEQHMMQHCGPFDIIHIDGDHTLPGKLLDLELAHRLLAPGGYVLVDDYGYPVHICVKQAVCRVVAMGMFKKFASVPTYRGMAVLQV